MAWCSRSGSESVEKYRRRCSGIQVSIGESSTGDQRRRPMEKMSFDRGVEQRSDEW